MTLDLHAVQLASREYDPRFAMEIVDPIRLGNFASPVEAYVPGSSSLCFPSCARVELEVI